MDDRRFVHTDLVKRQWREHNLWKLLFKVYEYGSVVLLVGITVLSLFAIYSRIHKESAVRLLSVVSGSMEPAVPVGSAVLVFPQRDYFINDVVTYQMGSTLVTHRVMYAGKYFLTKGDANKEIDPKTVDRSHIVGRVGFVVPYLGYVQEWSKSLWGLLLLVWLPTLVIVVHEAIIVHRELGKISFDFFKKEYVKAGVLILGLLVGSQGVVYSYFSSQQVVGSIQVSVAQSTSTPKPSSTPQASASSSPRPSRSPFFSMKPFPSIPSFPSFSPIASASATPRGSGSCRVVAVNEGNGEGSVNEIEVECEEENEINQVNN